MSETNETPESSLGEKTNYFIDYPSDLYGEAVGVGLVDIEQIPENWPTEKQMQRLGLGEESSIKDVQISMYGLSVYREVSQLKSKGMSVLNDSGAVNLDPRVFSAGTDLLAVLSEAAHCAADKRDVEAIDQLMSGVIAGVQIRNNTGTANMEDARSLLSPLLRGYSSEHMKIYVDVLAGYVGPKGHSRTAEHIRQLSGDIGRLLNENLSEESFRELELQSQLKNLAVLWINKELPPSKIDWLKYEVV